MFEVDKKNVTYSRLVNWSQHACSKISAHIKQRNYKFYTEDIIFIQILIFLLFAK